MLIASLHQVQEVLTALHISRLEARDETCMDVRGCLNERLQQTVAVAMEGEVAAARDLVGVAYGLSLRKLQGLVFETEVGRTPRSVLIACRVRVHAECMMSA